MFVAQRTSATSEFRGVAVLACDLAAPLIPSHYRRREIFVLSLISRLGWVDLLKRRGFSSPFFLSRISKLFASWRTCGFMTKVDICLYLSDSARQVVIGLDSLLREGTFRLGAGLAAFRTPDSLTTDLTNPKWKFYRSSPGGD